MLVKLPRVRCWSIYVYIVREMWFPQILWRRSEMIGDRSRQLPRMPLPDFVRALTFVRADKLGWYQRAI